MAKNDFAGELRVLQKLNQYEFAVEIWIMRSGVNRNRWDFQNIEQHYRSFAGQPILTAYVGQQVGDGHNSQTKVDPTTGETYNSYMGPTDERIVGIISENEEDITLEERGGDTWIVAKGRLWRVYAPELVDKIVRTGRMDVSAETNVREERRENDIDILTDWDGIGVTILGDYVEPAIPGANIRALAAMEQEFKTMQLHVASLLDQRSKKNNSEKRSERTVEIFNKKQMAELEVKFPGYTVLAAARSDNGIHVCLMAADGATATYTMAAEDETIATEKISKCNAQVQFLFGEETLHVSACDLTDKLSADLVKANSRAEKAEKDLETANETIRTMETAEKQRRRNAAKEAAKRELEAINANRCEAERMGDEVINAVVEAAERGDYDECCDGEAQWNGEAVAAASVRSAAMEKQMAFDKANAEKKRAASRRQYAWEMGASHTGDEDSVEAMYNAMTGEN